MDESDSSDYDVDHDRDHEMKQKPSSSTQTNHFNGFNGPHATVYSGNNHKIHQHYHPQPAAHARNDEINNLKDLHKARKAYKNTKKNKRKGGWKQRAKRKKLKNKLKRINRNASDDKNVFCFLIQIYANNRNVYPVQMQQIGEIDVRSDDSSSEEGKIKMNPMKHIPRLKLRREHVKDKSKDKKKEKKEKMHKKKRRNATVFR
eukprot:392099_1